MANATSQVQNTKRQYPGDALAADIFAHVKSPAELSELVRRAHGNPHRELEKELRKGKMMSFGASGSVGIEPVTPRGKAIFAVWKLILQGRIRRIRQCRHCGALFYARFEHQKFCSNPKTKCQWNHYHTSEWRKRHRERNRKHQQEYRKRLFTKGGKR